MFVQSLFHWRYMLAVNIAALIIVAPARAEFGDQLLMLTAGEPMAGDSFGSGVAVYRDTVLVSATEFLKYPTAPYAGPGFAGLFNASTGNQLHKLTASDAAAGDEFSRVAIFGNTALVGARLNDDPGNASGSAYVFDVTTGQETRKLTASDVVEGNQFGTAVALFGNTAIVSTGGVNVAKGGAAYVFDITTGHELMKLTPSDGVPGDLFGGALGSGSVAISGTTAIVGARSNDEFGNGFGAAYLFDVTTGQELHKLHVVAGGGFGYSVAIFGNKAIVGAPYNGNGAAYLFDVTTGQELYRLEPSDITLPPFATAEFGSSVAINGNTAIVGTRFENAAYLFDVTTGELLTKLNGPSDGQFGLSVAISDNLAVVGARVENNWTGAAYVFDVSRNLVLAGDFNTDGTVDAADYIVWRNGLETTYTQTDYNTWRANFGRSAAAATAVAGGNSIPPVPEPSTRAILAITILADYFRRRRDGRIPRSGRQASRTFPDQRSAAAACRLLALSPG
jgi:outer membrane protein assembly factor BamB